MILRNERSRTVWPRRAESCSRAASCSAGSRPIPRRRSRSWRSRHALDDDDPRVDLVLAISRNTLRSVCRTHSFTTRGSQRPHSRRTERRLSPRATTGSSVSGGRQRAHPSHRYWLTPMESLRSASVPTARSHSPALKREASSSSIRQPTVSRARYRWVKKASPALQFDADRFLAQSGSLDGSTIGVFSVQKRGARLPLRCRGGGLSDECCRTQSCGRPRPDGGVQRKYRSAGHPAREPI